MLLFLSCNWLHAHQKTIEDSTMPLNMHCDVRLLIPGLRYYIPKENWLGIEVIHSWAILRLVVGCRPFIWLLSNALITEDINCPMQLQALIINFLRRNSPPEQKGCTRIYRKLVETGLVARVGVLFSFLGISRRSARCHQVPWISPQRSQLGSSLCKGRVSVLSILIGHGKEHSCLWLALKLSYITNIWPCPSLCPSCMPS